jgi:hypothetical protein
MQMGHNLYIFGWKKALVLENFIKILPHVPEISAWPSSGFMSRGLIVIILADLFGGFILPFLNLPLFSKPKVADFFFEI